MSDPQKNAPGAFGAQGAMNIERLDSAAQQDFTPSAIDSSLLLALLKITTARAHLRNGELESTLVASLEGERSLVAAVHSLSAIVG
jgi:hypothetical protein